VPRRTRRQRHEPPSPDGCVSPVPRHSVPGLPDAGFLKKEEGRAQPSRSPMSSSGQPEATRSATSSTLRLGSDSAQSTARAQKSSGSRSPRATCPGDDGGRGEEGPARPRVTAGIVFRQIHEAVGLVAHHRTKEKRSPFPSHEPKERHHLDHADDLVHPRVTPSRPEERSRSTVASFSRLRESQAK